MTAPKMSTATSGEVVEIMDGCATLRDASHLYNVPRLLVWIAVADELDYSQVWELADELDAWSREMDRRTVNLAEIIPEATANLVNRRGKPMSTPDRKQQGGTFKMCGEKVFARDESFARGSPSLWLEIQNEILTYAEVGELCRELVGWLTAHDRRSDERRRPRLSLIGPASESAAPEQPTERSSTEDGTPERGQ